MSQVVLLLLLCQSEVTLRPKPVAVARGELDYYFWGADGKGAIYGGRWDGAARIVVTDFTKDREVYAGGRWHAASMSGDRKRIVLLGRGWNGDDILAEAEDGKFEVAESYRADMLGAPLAVSPDGKKVAYPGLHAQRPHLLLEDTGTAQIKPLIPCEGRLGTLLWSNDGKLVALDVARGQAQEVWVVDAASGERKLLLADARYWTPAFSPDGKRIAAVSDRNNQLDLYVLPMASPGEIRRLTADGAPKRDVAWSPKDNWIVVRCYRDMKWSFVFATPKGDRVRYAKMDVRPHGPPLWSPRGDQLMFLSVLESGADALVTCGPP